jgi:hypothetical protein
MSILDHTRTRYYSTYIENGGGETEVKPFGCAARKEKRGIVGIGVITRFIATTKARW